MQYFFRSFYGMESGRNHGLPESEREKVSNWACCWQMGTLDIWTIPVHSIKASIIFWDSLFQWHGFCSLHAGQWKSKNSIRSRLHDKSLYRGVFWNLSIKRIQNQPFCFISRTINPTYRSSFQTFQGNRFVDFMVCDEEIELECKRFIDFKEIGGKGILEKHTDVFSSDNGPWLWSGR